MANSENRENGLITQTTSSYRKLHRIQRHVQFTTECSIQNIIPTFCKLPYQLIDNGNLTLNEITTIQKRNLENALQENKQKLLILKNEWEKNLENLSYICVSPSHFNNLVSNIKNSVFHSEKYFDEKRDLKLQNLKNQHIYPFNSAKVHNETGVVIPNDILSLLYMGNNFSIGGSTRNHGSKIFLELNKIYEIFRKNGRKLGVSELNIEYIRSHISLCGTDVSSCFTKDPRIASYFKFKKLNPEILVLSADKTQDFVILTKEQYQSKINDFLDNPKYQKIPNFDLKFEMQSYRSLLKSTMDGCVGQQNAFLLQPASSICKLYGKVKVHKEHWPIRGICTGYSHMVLGAETYLKKILKPLLNRCSYLVNSQLAFKNKFMLQKTKFRELEHEIVSFDINSMYPSINITKVANYIITAVFRDPRNFFKERDNTGRLLPHPTKEQFKLFLLGVLSDFNYFETHDGIYKQIQGVQMGSSLAPLIANLFIGCLERSVIHKLKRQGHIITWLRYADDNLTIIKKGSFDHILNELNSWDHNISYSFEKMNENKLNFLSTTVFVKNEEIQFQPFRKAGPDTILSNYKQAVISRKYLISTMFTLLHHAEYSSSTRDIFIQDLKNQKEIFLKNAYSEKIVDEILPNT